MYKNELTALVSISEASWFYLPRPVSMTKKEILYKGTQKALFELEDKEEITSSMFKNYIDFFLKELDNLKGLKGEVKPIRVRADITAKDILTQALSKQTKEEEKLRSLSLLAAKAGFSEPTTVRKVLNKIKAALLKLKEGIELLTA